jgi:hypothetical protein
MKGRFTHYLDVTSTVLVIIASGTIIILASTQWRNSRATTRPPSNYEVNDSFAPVNGVDWSSHPSTIVLWLRSSCRFCTASMPFYKQLIGTSRRARIVAMGTEQPEQLLKYLTDHGVVPDAVVSVPLGSVRLFATPIIVHVSQNGRVLSLWRGQLDAGREVEVIEAAK